MKKFFVKDNFQSRPSHALVNVFANPGIIMYNGEEWRTTKRFTMKALKSLGFGRSVFEPQMHLEIDFFLKEIEKRSKLGTIKIAQLTGAAASNVVSLIVLGERYDYSSQTRKMFDDVFLRPMGENDLRPIYMSPLAFVKSARLLIHANISSIKFWKKWQSTSSEFIKKRAEKIKAIYDPKTEPRNYIECFFKEVDENKDNASFDMKYFDETHLLENCYAFFTAGSSTTQEYLEWWFMIMANYPQVQEKMRTEVDSIVGDEKATISMRNKMPYTEAVLAEVHRFSSLVGLNAPHIAQKDSQFGPYFLPAGTQIILNLNEIHHDPNNFYKPDQFIPERFISEDGKKFIRSDKLIPFGHGKRSCAGEALAQAEIFLFTTSTLKKFIIKSPTNWNGKTYNGLCTRLPEDATDIIAQRRQ